MTDVQKCDLKFESWAYTEDLMKLKFMPTQKGPCGKYWGTFFLLKFQILVPF